jgi:TRAP-type transport system periplasmic protein
MTPGRTREMKKSLTVVAVLAVVAGFHVATADSPKLIVRLSIAGNQQHPYYAGAVKFKEVLDRGSQGKIEVKIFENSQLGDEAASLELVRKGGLEFTEHLTSIAASAYKQPTLQAWSLPFLYPDSRAAYKAWDSDVATRSYAMFEPLGFKCLARWDAGFRELSSMRPVNSLADVKGLKVRTPAGQIYLQTWRSLGAVPVPMAITELYTALQTGVVSGTELPLQALVSLKYYEVQKSAAVLNYMNDPICFSTSVKFFGSLSPELQQAVLDAVTAATSAERQASVTQAEAAVAQLKKLGLSVTQPPLDPFRAAVAPVYDEYYTSVGAAGRDLVHQIQQVIAKP